MHKNASFPTTTLWTQVVYASDPGHPRVQLALTELFRLYWYPIYANLRRRGIKHHDAEDLTQGFFYAVEHHMFHKADRAKGRFRTFVLACLENFLHDDYRHRTALKRGGHQKAIEFDGLAADARYAIEPLDTRSPEQVFTETFALEVFDGAMRQLAAEAADDGDSELFAALRDYIGGDDADESYRTISARINIKVGTLKSHTSRFRDRLCQLLKERADQIVSSRKDVDDELLALEESLEGTRPPFGEPMPAE